jgi:CheY-like chemotaxis protein
MVTTDSEDAKAGAFGQKLPAVALTAFAQKDERLRVLRAGFQVHVSKPIDPYELIAIVASLAGRTG